MNVVTPDKQTIECYDICPCPSLNLSSNINIVVYTRSSLININISVSIKLLDDFVTIQFVLPYVWYIWQALSLAVWEGKQDGRH